MRVMIDGRPLQGPTGRRGVGHYVRGLMRGLGALDPPLEIVLLVDPRGEAPLGLALSDFAVARAAAPPGPALLWGRVLGPLWIAKAHPDVVHSTFLAPPRAPARTPCVATIHDLIVLHHPGAFTWRQRLVFRRSLGRLLTGCSECALRGDAGLRKVSRPAAAAWSGAIGETTPGKG